MPEHWYIDASQMLVLVKLLLKLFVQFTADATRLQRLWHGLKLVQFFFFFTARKNKPV